MDKDNAASPAGPSTILLNPHPTRSSGKAGIHGSFLKPIRDIFTPTTNIDFLGDVLGSLRVDSCGLCLCEFREPWGMQVDDLPMPCSWTVLEGTVWLRRQGMVPIAFHRGDTFLLPRGIADIPCVVASSSDIKPATAGELWREAELRGFELGAFIRQPQHMRWGGVGNLTRVVSTVFTFHDHRMSPLMAALPELMIIRATEAQDEVDLIETLMRFALNTENKNLAGYCALSKQIAQLLLALVIRVNALSNGDGFSGWLAGMGDPQIARALTRIYREPEHHWTVEALARTAGMSRSVFAERFFERVGQTPMQYLRAWRMHLAMEALAVGNSTVTMLAQDLGYRSEAAFRTAFRSATGLPPREFRRNAGIKALLQATEGI